MHANDNHPGLKKFRAIKAREKAAAIKRAAEESALESLRTEIRENNASLSEPQVQQIAQAALRAKNATHSVAVKGRKNKGRQRGQKIYSVKVEVVNKL